MGGKPLVPAEQVVEGTYVQTWDWTAPNWDELTDPAMTSVGWIDGPGLSAEMKADLDNFISGLASGEINVWTGPINLQDGTDYIADGAEATDNEIWYLPMLLEGMVGPSE